MNARVSLSYTLLGLAARDQTLFKSFVRLIDHRTLHQWSFSSSAADLQVVSEDSNLSVGDGPVLTLGVTRKSQADYLCMPLHAVELEAVLNDLGARLCAARAHAGAVPRMHVRENAELVELAGENVKLLRWPPVDLLNSSERIRMATLMTGRPVSIASVQARSHLPIQLCTAFFHDLRQAGLLRTVTTQHTASPPAVPTTGAHTLAPVGLLERIRVRLGLSLGHRA